MTRSERLEEIRKRAAAENAREWGPEEDPPRFLLDALEDIPWLLAEVERLESRAQWFKDRLIHVYNESPHLDYHQTDKAPERFCHMCQAVVPLSHDCTGRTP